MHVMAGQEVTFSCGGEALAILWFINDQNIDDLGIKDVFEKVEDFRTSNITVSDVIEYHNATIQCVLYLSSITINSLPPVLLTVFGKPQISNLINILEIVQLASQFVILSSSLSPSLPLSLSGLCVYLFV